MWAVDAIEALGLHDVVVEYEITSNRVDCYSVIGMAREAAATFHKDFYPPVVTETGNSEDVNDYIKVKVEDTGSLPQILCPGGKEHQVWHRRRSGCRDGWRPMASVPSITW